jgi:hypothetical protein
MNVTAEHIQCFWSQPMLAKVLQQYLIFTRAGDFNRNHIGPTAVPDDILEDIIPLMNSDIRQAMHTNQVMLATVLEAYPRGEIAKSIEYLDLANAFTYGVIIVLQIQGKCPSDTGLSDEEFLAPEADFVATVEKLARDHGLTGTIANQELRRSKRNKMIKIWPRWIDDLLIHPLQRS